MPPQSRAGTERPASPPPSPLARLSFNTLCMYGAWAVRKVSILLLTVVIGRTAGLSDFGVYCLALVWMEAAIRLAEFGTDILIVKALSARDARAADWVGNAFVWRIAACVAIYPLSILAARPLHGGGALAEVVAVMGVGMIAQAMGNFYLSLVQGRERVDLHAFAQAASSVLGLILGIAAVRGGHGLQGLALAYALRGAFCLLLGMGLCRRLRVTVRPGVDPRLLRQLLADAAPIGLNRLLTVLYLGSGMTVLQWARGDAAVGLFAAAMKIFEACSAFGTLTMVAAFPTLARLQAASRDGLRRTSAAIVRLFCWGGIPLSLAVALNARPLLSLFGSDFQAGAPALALLMAAIPFSLHSELAERLAYAHTDQKKVLLVRFIGISLNMLVLSLTVGPLGYLAPAPAILAAEALMLALFLPLWTGYLPPRGAPSRLPGDPLAWRFVALEGAPCPPPAGFPSRLRLFAARYLRIEQYAIEQLRLFLRCALAIACIAGGLCHLSRRFFLRDKIVILAYHRVADGDDPLGLNVSPRRFQAQMRFLRRHFDRLDLDAVAERLKVPGGSGSTPTANGAAAMGRAGPKGAKLASRAAVAVTFDDGYRGDLAVLERTLSEHRVPTAIFVAPALVEDPRLAWWETLASILGEAGRRGLGLFMGEPGVRVDLRNRFLRRLCAQALAARLRHLPAGERGEHLARLAGGAAIDPAAGMASDTFLGPRELRRLTEQAGVTVGSHTQTHRPVTSDTESAFAAEFRSSAEALSAWTGRPVRHFAYPSGSDMRTGAARARALASAGFRTAATHLAGIVVRGSNPYELRRIGISGEPFPVFVAKVSGVFELVKRLAGHDRRSPAANSGNAEGDGPSRPSVFCCPADGRRVESRLRSDGPCDGAP